MARQAVLDHMLRSTQAQLQGCQVQEDALLQRLAPSAQLALPQGPALQSVLSWAAGIPLPDNAGVRCTLGSARLSRTLASQPITCLAGHGSYTQCSN